MTQHPTENAIKKIKRVPCEVYSRIVGYLRPVQDWNEGKQQEFSERHTYTVAEAMPAPAPQEEKACAEPESAR